MHDPILAKLLTTLILMFIGVAGAMRGLSALEKLEEYSVTIKLGILDAHHIRGCYLSSHIRMRRLQIIGVPI